MYGWQHSSLRLCKKMLSSNGFKWIFSYTESPLITTQVNRQFNVDFNKSMFEYPLCMPVLHQCMNTLFSGFEKKSINYVKHWAQPKHQKDLQLTFSLEGCLMNPMIYELHYAWSYTLSLTSVGLHTCKSEIIMIPIILPHILCCKIHASGKKINK